MKRILVCLLTCLLFTQIYVVDTYMETNTVYESDDFEIDKIYHFKKGDSIKFSDGDLFDISLIDENGRVVVSDVNEYVFENNFDAYIYNYSVVDYRYIRLHKTFNINYHLMGKGDDFVVSTKSYYYAEDNHTEFFAYLPPVPTAINYMFDGWYLEDTYETKVEYNSNSVKGWDSYGEYRVYDDADFYAKWVELSLTCIEAKSGEDTKIQIIPVADNQRVYDVTDFNKEDRPLIGIEEIDSNGVVIQDLGQIEYDETEEGYFYTNPFEDDEEHILKFYVVDNETINTNYVVDSIDVEAEGILVNDAYPWGSDFKVNNKKYEVTLNTKLGIDANSIKYKWQASYDNAIYEDIANGNNNKLKVSVKNPNNYKPWYRCVVDYVVDGNKYECISKPVKILDSRNLKEGIEEQYGALYNVNSSRNIEGIMDGLYVSNDESAYILGKDIQYFNVLGKYNNGLKDYWISCSCDAAWAIYQKDENGFVGSNNIKNVICGFDEENNVVVNVSLRKKADVAIYTDTCIGRFPEIYYADGAAMKANLDESNNLKSIYMVANNNFKDANLEDTVGFKVEPITNIDTFNIDAYLNGPYHKVNEKMDKYEYVINDYNNEDGLTYKEIFELLKNKLFDYCYGLNYETYSGGNDPFVYRTINDKKTVVAIRSKDSVLSFAYNNVDNVAFKMNIGNAIDLGIDNVDLYNIKPSVDPVTPVDPVVPSFIPPQTGVN